MAGCSLVHVNRTLRTLRQSGAIETDIRGFRIVDWLALERQADFDPGYLGNDARMRRAA